MAYTKKLKDANIYFRPDAHMAGKVWEDLDAGYKEAAFAEAKRMLEHDAARVLADPDDDAGNLEARDDYAHYEQTLWLCVNNPYRSKGDSSGIAFQAGNVDGETMQRRQAQIGPAAMKWMGWGTLELARG